MRYRSDVFLGDALALCGVAIRQLPGAPKLRAQVEDRIGAPLPDAFAELILSDAWPSLLERFSNGDRPLPVSALGEPFGGYGPVYHPKKECLLPFMSENQGVCTWAIPLDKGPNPPVLVEVDSMPAPSWSIACESFGLWLYCQVWDGLLLERAMFTREAMTGDDGCAYRVGRARWARGARQGRAGSRRQRLVEALFDDLSQEK